MPEEISDLLPDPGESSGDAVDLLPDTAPDPEPDVLDDGESSSLVDPTPDDGPSDVDATGSSQDETGQAEGEAPDPGQGVGQAFFEYGDRQFGNAQELTQYLRSWDGRLRVAAEAADRLAGFNDQWVQWSNDPEKIAEQYRKLTGQEISSAAGDNPDEGTPDYSKYADGPTAEHYKMFERLVQEGRGLDALRMMDEIRNRQVKAQQNQFQNELKALKDELTAPTREATEERNATVSLLDYAYNAADREGNLLYPELVEHSGAFNEEFTTLFADVYKSLDKETRLLPNGDGVELAYQMAHRLWDMSEQSEQTTPNTPEPVNRGNAANLARDAKGRFINQSKATQEAVGGSGSNPPPRETPASYREAHDIISGMDNAIERDPKLGLRR